jgi:sugar lactone lactonase YvrE
MIWIGTNGGGINRFDRKTGKFTRFLHDPNDPASLSLNEIRSVYQDRTGALWIGTYGGGLDKLIPGDSPVFQHYRNDPDDPNSLSNDFVRATFEDSDGDFWVGTEGGGLNKFDREKETFTHYLSDPSNPHSLNNDYIFSIHEDRSGYLWLSTWGGGINKFDKQSEEFTHYTEEDGLPNDAVYGIMEDAQGNLWMSTNNGLSRFNPETKTFRNFTVQDGLQNNEFNGGSFFMSKSGEMFFGGIAGFNSFYPENIEDNPYVPPVVITSFSKLNEEVELHKPFSEIEGLTLSHKDYVFSFEFAALDFTAPEKNMYAYRMEGLDEDWVHTNSKKRYATYTTLAPGTYTFRVKGSNSDGVWNEQGTSMKITIVPPFWKTMWFRLISALILMSLVAVWYRRRSKNIELIAELRTAREAQMSIMPHDDPVVDGFEISGICIPANTVGGDFFDYFWLNDKRTHFGIAVGDVSGKAMESAMTAVMANGMIYSKIELDGISVSDMMTSLNRPMFAKTDRKMFTALCLASLDVAKRALTFTNAGLIEPLLKSGDSVRYIEGTGSKHPLGLIEDAAYQSTSLQLTSGDVVLLLTDGIPEAQNHSRQLYSDERLKELLRNMDTSSLSAAEIKQKIIDDVEHFSGNASQHDDMTVIVMKVL